MTYHITYKKKYHPSIVRADLASLARVSDGEFFHDGGSIGMLTCSHNNSWFVDQQLNTELIQTFSKK